MLLPGNVYRFRWRVLCPASEALLHCSAMPSPLLNPSINPTALRHIQSFNPQIKLPGAEPFRLCRELLDGVVMVDNGTIATALKVRCLL